MVSEQFGEPHRKLAEDCEGQYLKAFGALKNELLEHLRAKLPMARD